MSSSTSAASPFVEPSLVLLASAPGFRVPLPRAEFRRLGLGDHERPNAIPECFRWCLERLGPGGALWSVRLPPRGDGWVDFAEAADAAAFRARWSRGSLPLGH